jgi:hypothetical protein
MAKTAIMGLEPKRITKTLEQEFKPVQQEEDTELPAKGVKKVIHHDLFMYPPKPQPNPALAAFFEKLKEIKKVIDNS